MSNTPIINHGEELAKVYTTVTLMARKQKDNLFLLPNALRTSMFRLRFNLVWQNVFEPTNSSGDLLLNVKHVVEAYVVKYPGLTGNEISNKIIEHIRNNDLQWGIKIGLISQLNQAQNRVNNVIRNNRNPVYEVEVSAQDIEYGSASYSATRYYNAIAEIPDDVLEEACQNDDVEIVLSWIYDDFDIYSHTSGETEDYEYEDHNPNDSSDFQYRNEERMRAAVERLMAQFRDNNRELFGGEDEE